MALAVISGLVTFLLSSATLANGEPKFRRVSDPIPGHYIVVLDTQPSATNLISNPFADAIAAKYGGILTHYYDRAFLGFAGWFGETEARALSEDPGVTWVEEDGFAW